MARIFILIIWLGIAFQGFTQSMSSNDARSSIGLFTPIIVESDWKEIYLSDYLLGPQDVDVTCPNHIELERLDKEIIRIKLIGQGAPVTHLSVKTNQGDFAIPLIQSNKKRVDFSFDPQGIIHETVQLVGDINAWNPANTPLSLSSDGSWKTSLYLTPGTYGYQMVTDGNWNLDQNNPDSMSNGQGGYNSTLIVPGPKASDYPFFKKISHSPSTLNVTLSQNNSLVAFWNNTPIPSTSNDDHYKINIPAEAKNQSRSFIRLYAYNSSYGKGADQLIPLRYGRVITSTSDLSRMDKQSMIMYFLMVDRFFNADRNNDEPTKDPQIAPQANHLGGDLEGVSQRLSYIKELGINTLWLSPIVQNAIGAYGYYDEGGVTSKFSSYHGYWPISFTNVDYRFGTNDDLQTLVDQCHGEDMNIILDFIANHVHETHPIYLKHKNDGWTTELYLPDGTLNTEKWDEHRLTTWFDTHLPSLNLEKEEVSDMLVDSAVYWIEKYNIDGFRHDATKHIPLSFWRALTKKIKHISSDENRPIYQVGETYGTPELISSYINTGMLDGQFDFNVFDAVLNSVCRNDVGFEVLAERLRQSIAYYGNNHLMGNMSGNQDKPRLMSMASGDISFEEDSKLAGWTRDIELQTATGFKRVAIMHAINFFIPGVPCIYYGDEFGMPGGNDPDNRRMMKFDQYSIQENNTINTVQSLARTRTQHMALNYGSFNILEANNNRFVATRTYMDEMITLLINNGPSMESFDNIDFTNATVLSGSARLLHDKILLKPFEFVIIK